MLTGRTGGLCQADLKTEDALDVVHLALVIRPVLGLACGLACGGGVYADRTLVRIPQAPSANRYPPAFER